MNSIDLVVAHYREDLSWLRRVHNDFQIHLFSKGEQVADGATALPNVGREAHTYLKYIVDRYDELKDWTAFCQGFPFDHEPAFHRRLNQFRAGDVGAHLFLWVGLFVDYDTGDGTRLFSDWSKNEDGRRLALDEFWSQLFRTPNPERYIFFPGGQFMIHRDQIHKRPIEFYRQALEVAETFPDAAHCFERCWHQVFLAPGFDEPITAKPMPIHLRPNKGLGITWETCGVIPGHPFYSKNSE